MGEFDVIRRYFTRPTPAAHVVLGIGDDCALLTPDPGQRLAISTDMLVEGRHFFADVDPHALGHKALAVNLSDLAAMGAEPLGFTLALALPHIQEPWLASFSQGLFALAEAHYCPLIGGDTTQGPLNLCITVFGQVPPQQELRRNAAQVGDDIWVSGTLGDARWALEALLGQRSIDVPVLERLRQRLERPTPRLALGQALRGIAHAAADLSDGLCGDLAHILNASGVGAELHLPSLVQGGAISNDLRALSLPDRLRCMLSGGDDYELVFTAAATAQPAVAAAARYSHTPVTRIGCITATPGLRCVDAAQQAVDISTFSSFNHFA